MIISLKDKRTTAGAQERNGVTYLASEGRSHRAWRRPTSGGLVAGQSCRISVPRSASPSISGSPAILGGFDGLDQAQSRMFAAPRPLGPSANQEEGDP